MKVIIAGSRTIIDYTEVLKAIKGSGFEITELVCGMAVGVDELGYIYAQIHNIPIKEMPAIWSRHGSAAGPIRNEQMARYAEALIIVWDGESKGSKNMLHHAKKYNLKVHEVIINQGPQLKLKL